MLLLFAEYIIEIYYIIYNIYIYKNYASIFTFLIVFSTTIDFEAIIILPTLLMEELKFGEVK